MAEDATPRPSRPVQAEALEAIVRRMARAEAAPWLHGEVAQRMAGRLPLIRVQPQRLLDWWSFQGGGAEALRQAYPAARQLQVEHEAAAERRRAAKPPRRWWPLRQPAATPSWQLAREVQPGDADLLWANMVLHLRPDPLQQLREWHRALAVDGFLMFSTLGPGSLSALRQLYAREGWPSPHAAFVDMHDLGDMLVQAGFADPVMDQEQLTLTWPDADALLGELRSLGGNADSGRASGLRTPRWRRRLGEALEALRGADGRLRLEFEVVYGHAWRVAPKPRVAAQTAVGLDEMRAMVRAGRRGPGSA